MCCSASCGSATRSRCTSSSARAGGAPGRAGTDHELAAGRDRHAGLPDRQRRSSSCSASCAARSSAGSSRSTTLTTTYGIIWLVALLGTLGLIANGARNIGPQFEGLKDAPDYRAAVERMRAFTRSRPRAVRRRLHLHDPHALPVSGRPMTNGAAVRGPRSSCWSWWPCSSSSPASAGITVGGRLGPGRMVDGGGRAHRPRARGDRARPAVTATERRSSRSADRSRRSSSSSTSSSSSPSPS